MIDTAWAMGSAPAGGASPAGGGSILDLFLPFIVIIGIFYFLLIRPQQKQQRKHQDMVRSLQRGDGIVTSGGLYGTVVNADDSKYLLVQIADKVRVKIERSAVSARVEGEKEQ